MKAINLINQSNLKQNTNSTEPGIKAESPKPYVGSDAICCAHQH